MFFRKEKEMDPNTWKKQGYSLIEYKGPLDSHSKQALPLLTFDGKIYLCIKEKDIEKVKKYRNLMSCHTKK